MSEESASPKEPSTTTPKDDRKTIEKKEISSSDKVEKVKATKSSTKKISNSIKLHFKAVGGAKILKRRKFKMKPEKAWSVVSTFLRRQLKLKANDPLFTYINSAFCPSPDQLVGNLFQNFQVNDELVVNYSITNAWG